MVAAGGDHAAGPGSHLPWRCAADLIRSCSRRTDSLARSLDAATTKTSRAAIGLRGLRALSEALTTGWPAAHGPAVPDPVHVGRARSLH